MQGFERVKTVHATDRTTTAIGLSAPSSYKMKLIQKNNVLLLQHAPLHSPELAKKNCWLQFWKYVAIVT
jgi:hypothetical protein